MKEPEASMAILFDACQIYIKEIGKMLMRKEALKLLPLVQEKKSCMSCHKHYTETDMAGVTVGKCGGGHIWDEGCEFHIFADPTSLLDRIGYTLYRKGEERTRRMFRL
jgi:hypothetical protein